MKIEINYFEENKEVVLEILNEEGFITETFTIKNVETFDEGLILECLYAGIYEGVR